VPRPNSPRSGASPADPTARHAAGRTGATEPAAEGELLRRAAIDREAFAVLYARWFDPVYWYCYGRLGTREAAEDAASIVFAKVLAALPRFDPAAGSFRAWLFTIAHHAVADSFRAQRRDRPLDAALDLVDPAPAGSPEEMAVAAEERRALLDLLDRLTPGQRRVVELRLAGLSGPEIARVLGRSRGAVDAVQFRAVARLRDLMGVPTRSKETRDATR